jgi:hypothetical protein
VTTGTDWARPASLDGQQDRGVVGDLLDGALGDPRLVSAGFRTGADGRSANFVETRRRRWWHRNEPGRPKDRAGTWLRRAMFALAVLAAAAAIVSYEAQYRLVYDTKHVKPIALIQAGIPDAGALVFACLGIALALCGKRALRARALNLACVGLSIAMNALASSAGLRALSVWVMAPVIYALASDTLIGVIRAIVIARQKQLDATLADDETTPLSMLGGVLLWVLRLVWAPLTTIKGFRAWVIEECPVAPGRRAQLPARDRKALDPGDGKGARPRSRSRGHRARGRRRGGRDWAALSEPVRRRYEAAGIDQAAYERGDDLTAARGHAGGAS